MRTRLHTIQDRIKLYQKKVKVDLLAASKMWTIGDIVELYHQGQRLFGESKVQEAARKFLSEPLVNMCDIKLHMIGRLQRNKVKQALMLFDCIQSVNTMALVEKIVRVSNSLKQSRRTKSIFFQVNPCNDGTKTGFVKFSELVDAIMYFVKNSNISIRGLMVIASIGRDTKNTFSLTEEWAEYITELVIPKLPKDVISHPLELSMGMSSDFVTAIECGSTMVRMGSALFGDRTYE